MLDGVLRSIYHSTSVMQSMFWTATKIDMIFWWNPFFFALVLPTKFTFCAVYNFQKSKENECKQLFKWKFEMTGESFNAVRYNFELKAQKNWNTAWYLFFFVYIKCCLLSIKSLFAIFFKILFLPVLHRSVQYFCSKNDVPKNFTSQNAKRLLPKYFEIRLSN